MGVGGDEGAVVVVRRGGIDIFVPCRFFVGATEVAMVSDGGIDVMYAYRSPAEKDEGLANWAVTLCGTTVHSFVG